MKIGIIISSLTKNIPYMTYLVSNGYDVIPIVLKNEINSDKKENFYLKNIIKSITQREIIDNSNILEEDKLDCLILLDGSKNIQTLKTICYSNVLKINAPIIINSHTQIDTKLELFSNYTIHSINYLPLNIIDECNYIAEEVKKVLQKK